MPEARIHACDSSAAKMRRCPRCDGLLYLERLSAGLCEDAYAHHSLACLNCGNRLSYTILKNRLARPPYQYRPTRKFPLQIST